MQKIKYTKYHIGSTMLSYHLKCFNIIPILSEYHKDSIMRSYKIYNCLKCAQYLKSLCVLKNMP